MQLKMLLNIPFPFGTGVSCAVLDLPDLCCEKKKNASATMFTLVFESKLRNY